MPSFGSSSFFEQSDLLGLVQAAATSAVTADAQALQHAQDALGFTQAAQAAAVSAAASAVTAALGGGTTVTFSSLGDHTAQNYNLFGTPALRMAARGNANAIVGIADNNTTPGTVTFPTGVTGAASLNSAGGVAFGLYGRADGYTAGIVTSEVNSMNWSTASVEQTLPPNRAFGTTSAVPVALTVASGGTAPSAIGVQICREGSSPQPMFTGLYVNPDATTNYAVVVDATASVGPTFPVVLRAKDGAVNLMLQTPGTYAAANAVMTITKADGTVMAALKQDGTYYIPSGWAVSKDTITHPTLGSVIGSANIGSGLAYNATTKVLSATGGGGGGVALATTGTPAMDGTAALGVATTAAASDHVHPTDTSRYAASNPSGFQTAAQVASAVSGGTSTNVSGIVAVANGGTGSSTAAGAKTALGLATVATTGAYSDLSSPPAIPVAASSTPLGPVAGGAVGTGATFARWDHQHPPPAQATTSALGLVKPDGTSITINGTTGAISAVAGALSTFAGTITGNGSTTLFTLTHNLGSAGVTTRITDPADGNMEVQSTLDVRHPTVNTTTVTFASAPANGVVYNTLDIKVA